MKMSELAEEASRRGIYRDDLWISPQGVEGPRVIVLNESSGWVVYLAWRFDRTLGEVERAYERRFPLERESEACDYALALAGELRRARCRRKLTRTSFIAVLTALGVRVTQQTFSWDEAVEPSDGYLFVDDGRLRATYC